MDNKARRAYYFFVTDEQHGWTFIDVSGLVSDRVDRVWFQQTVGRRNPVRVTDTIFKTGKEAAAFLFKWWRKNVKGKTWEQLDNAYDNSHQVRHPEAGDYCI